MGRSRASRACGSVTVMRPSKAPSRVRILVVTRCSSSCSPAILLCMTLCSCTLLQISSPPMQIRDEKKQFACKHLLHLGARRPLPASPCEYRPARPSSCSPQRLLCRVAKSKRRLSYSTSATTTLWRPSVSNLTSCPCPSLPTALLWAMRSCSRTARACSTCRSRSISQHFRKDYKVRL